MGLTRKWARMGDRALSPGAIYERDPRLMTVRAAFRSTDSAEYRYRRYDQTVAELARIMCTPAENSFVKARSSRSPII